MKKGLLLVFFLCCIKALTVAHPIVIKGHCTDHFKDSFILYTYKGIPDYIDYDEARMWAASTKPDANGNFRLTYELKQGQYFHMKCGSSLIFAGAFLQPKDSVYIEVADSQIGKYTIPMNHYYGSGAYSILYRDQYYQKDFLKYLSLYTLSKDSFVRLIDSLDMAEKVFFETFAKGKDLPKAYLEAEKLGMAYNWKNEKLVYIWSHEGRSGKTGIVKVDPSYFNFIAKADFKNEDDLNESNYFRFLHEYIYVMWLEKWEHFPDSYKKNNSVWGSKIEIDFKTHTIDSLFKGKIREVAYGELLIGMIRNLTYGDEKRKAQTLIWVDSLMEKIRPSDKELSGSIYERLKQKRNKTISLENKPAPGFTLKDTDDKMVSLSDFKGKVVLLDIWEYGCVPCMQAIPGSIKLQDDLKGKDFEMVAICFSPDKLWRLALKEHNWTGTHLLANPELKLMDKYNVDGFPHYLIIDKKGIIRSANADRPGEKLKAQIEELLKE